MMGMPFLDRVLFEMPWITMAVVGAATLLAAGYFNRRARTRATLTVLAVGFAICVGVYVLGASVETQREAARRHTHMLVNAIVAADYQTVDRLTADSMTIASSGSAAPDLRLKQSFIVDVTAGLDGVVRDHSTSIESIEADGPYFVTVAFNARSTVPEWSNIPTSWEVDWKKFEEGWKATRLELISAYGRDVDPGQFMLWGMRYSMNGMRSPTPIGP